MPRAIVVVDSHFPQRLHELREDRNLSLRDLGKLTNYSHVYLWEVESGRKQPTVQFAQRVDAALDARGELAAMVHERSALVPLSPDDIDRLKTVALKPRTVDRATLQSLSTVLAEQRRLEDAVGSAALVAPVLGQLAIVEDLAAEARGSIRRNTLDVAGQWAQFAGWLNANTHNPEAARRWYAAALEWATEIGDPNMIATALNMRGHLAWMLGQTAPMIGLSQAAGRQPATPGVRALAAQQEARGHALIGEGDDTDRRLDEAAALAVEAAAHAEDEPPWIYFHNPDYLRLQRGLAYRYLGRYAAVIDLLTAGLTAIPHDVRQSEWVGMYVFQLALAYYQSGNHTAACTVLNEVEQIATATGSPRLTAHARRLRHQLDTA